MRDASEVFSTFGPHAGEGSFLSWPRDRCRQVRLQFIFCAVATFIDAVGTAIHLARGAKELNPIWLNVIEATGAVPAMGIRLILGIVLLGVLFTLWQKPLARLGLMVVVAAFVPLTLYHIVLFIYLPLIG